MTPIARDACREAQVHVGPDYDPRVLEPSPPAVLDGQWFADDPAVRGTGDGRPVVTPTGDGDEPWSELAATDPSLGAWCAERWLAAWRPLSVPGASFAVSREALRRVACHVVAPARRAANGKIGLRFTLGGFGTPFFLGPAGDRQVRLAEGCIVVQDGGIGGRVESALLEEASLATAAALAGVVLADDPGVGQDVPALGDTSAPLAINSADLAALGDWYGFSASVLEQLRHELRAGEPSRVQLWPEHFDIAFDVDLGQRANIGCSPGDAAHDEPYVYIGPWNRDGLDGPFWNESFGAVLQLGGIVAAGDGAAQRSAVLSFVAEARQLLGGAA